MSDLKLEYRIAKPHKGFLYDSDVVVQALNPYWSYARKLPSDWDLSKIEKRTNVTTKILRNLQKISKGKYIDLTPLRDDQRASGTVYGFNPHFAMYTLIKIYSEMFPEQEFFAKWGGYQPEKPGKRFVFYVENEDEASLTIERLQHVASDCEIDISTEHKYGISQYKHFVDINEELRSPVKDKKGFQKFLENLEGHPHFFHEFFLSDKYIESQAHSRK